MKKSWVWILFCFTFIGDLAAQELLSSRTTTVEKFGDWLVRCEVNTQKERSCGMTQNLTTPDGKLEIAQANFARRGDETVMTIILRLGVHLPPGIAIEVKDHKRFEYPISFCSSEGCFVNEIISQEASTLLRKKELATVTFWQTPKAPIEVPMSINGFFDAYKQL